VKFEIVMTVKKTYEVDPEAYRPALDEGCDPHDEPPQALLNIDIENYMDDPTALLEFVLEGEEDKFNYIRVEGSVVAHDSKITDARENVT
jgi:hypothetical protein